MDRFRRRRALRAAVGLLAVALLLPSTGCVHRLLATMVYVWKGHTIPAAFDGLEDQRVVVVCRPPASLDYRHGGADRAIAERVAALLGQNIDNIDLVKQREVENWIDEQGWESVEELGTALRATRVVRIDLEDFSLLKGQTLYQGQAQVVVSVFDTERDGRELWQKVLGEVLFPVNSAVPAQEKPLPVFRRQFIEVLAEQIARNFYEHDAHLDFASDSTAHN